MADPPTDIVYEEDFLKSDVFVEDGVVSSFPLTLTFIQEAQQIIDQDASDINLSIFKKDSYEKLSGRNWQRYFEHNLCNSFKDRKWIWREFTELFESLTPEDASQYRLLDVGCGVGNASIPVLQKFPTIQITALDISKRAIDLYQKRIQEFFTPSNSENGNDALDASEKNSENRHDNINSYVWDITKDDITSIGQHVKSDFIFLIFVLSAIHPKHFDEAVRRVTEALQPGGILFFRDYGRYDLAQLRLAKSQRAKIVDNCYVRCDGTYAYYFKKEELTELFHKKHRLEEIENKYCLRLIQNRKTQVQMRRVWVQAKFRKPLNH